MKNNLTKKVLSCVVAVAMLAGLAVPTMAQPVAVPISAPVPVLAAPATSNPTVTKATVGQKTVEFTLSNSPVIAKDTKINVYEKNADNSFSISTGVKAEMTADNKITLSSAEGNDYPMPPFWTPGLTSGLELYLTQAATSTATESPKSAVFTVSEAKSAIAGTPSLAITADKVEADNKTTYTITGVTTLLEYSLNSKDYTAFTDTTKVLTDAEIKKLDADYEIIIRVISDPFDEVTIDLSYDDTTLTRLTAFPPKDAQATKGSILIGKESSNKSSEKFEYRRKGDTKWSYKQLNATSYLTDLVPGTYQIRMMGRNDGNSIFLPSPIEEVTILNSDDEKTQTGIEITTPPTNTDYKVGSINTGNFNDAGMKVSRLYNDGTVSPETPVTGYKDITTIPANGRPIFSSTEGVVAKWDGFTSPIVKLDVRYIVIFPQKEEILSGKGGEATFAFGSSNLKTKTEPFEIKITAPGSGITETEPYDGYAKPVKFENGRVEKFKFTIPSTIKAGTYNFTVFADSDTSNLLDNSAVATTGTIVVKQAPPPVLPPISGGSTGSTGSTDSTGSGSTAPTEPVVTAPPTGSTNTATEVKYDDVKTAAPEVTGDATVAAAAIILDETTAATATATNPVEIKAALSTADATSTINAATTKAVDFAFTVSDSISTNPHVYIQELKVDRDILQAAATAGKDISFGVKATDGTQLFSMSFKGSELKGKNLSDVNLALNVVEPSAAITKALPFASVLSFENNGAFPAPCTVTVNVTESYKDGTVLNLYYDNVKKGTLELVKQGITVAFGEAEATIDHASDYILSTALINTTSKPSINPATGVASTGVKLLGQLF